MALLENLKDKRIILASQSPRRQELLKGLEIDFDIITKPVEEVYPSNLKREAVPCFLSELKAAAFDGSLIENEILITSDTIVFLNGEILGKPKNQVEAEAMVGQLSGNKHTVITAVTISTSREKKTFYDETDVYFRHLTPQEIAHYVEVYQPYDKAGSYGVQELIGYIGIEKLVGSFYNVMGLPLHRLYEELGKL